MLLVFYFVSLAWSQETYIRVNRTLIDPRWSHISLDGLHDAAYVNAKGLELLNKKSISYSKVTRRPNRQKTLAELYDWNCTNTRFCRTFSIGNSTKGHPLLGARLTNFAYNKTRPEFVYLGNIHGDETVGRYVLARLIENLQVNTKILNALDIYIIPSLNPDGFLQGTRSNGQGFDLNRNFPDQFGWNTRPMQPETQAIIRWMKGRKFVMGANLHGGDIVANYGFDGNRQHRSGDYCATPDDPTFRYISQVYASNHRRMLSSREFPGGITNGCAWYVLYGGLQDWAYLQTGQFHITLELSFTKDPYTLAPYWDENRKSLYAFMNHARGF